MLTSFKMFTIRCCMKHNIVKMRTLQRIPVRNASSLKDKIVNKMKKHLVVVNSVTSGLFMALGDFISQDIEYYNKILPERYDWHRICRMFIAGCIIGPLHHVYYLYLDRILPGASLKVVIQKILADQFIASPLTIICFFAIMGCLEGKSLEDISKEFRKKFIYVYVGDWFFWPPTQFVNFYFLPWQYRVMYINFVTMIFNVYLSFVKHNV